MASLEMRDVHVNYDGAVAVDSVDLDLQEGQTLAIVGPNGAGKSSLLRAIARLVPSTGSILVNGQNLPDNPVAVVRQGVTLCPEGRQLFGDMSVIDNVNLGAFSIGDRDRRKELRDRVLEWMPKLADRSSQISGSLSGGEQQMLALGRAVMSDPKVLLLDEPSQGLAQRIKDEVAAQIERIISSGVSVLIVEQDAGFARDLSEEVAIMESGSIRFHGTWDELNKSPRLAREYLGM